MPKPIQSSIDSGDDDPYSEDDMLWHRGGSSLGGRKGSGTSFGGAKRVNSASASGNGNVGGPYGVVSPYANQTYSSVDNGSQVNNATGSEHAHEHCDHYGNPPSYTTAAARTYDYDDRSRDASIVGSSSYASSSSSTVQMSLRARIFSFAASPTSFSFSRLVKGKGKARERERLISTKPGERGAGETETELDEPPRHLPTARLAAPKAPLIPPHILEKRITPLLFQFSRLLSVVPSFIGMLWCILCIVHYESEEVTTRRRPERVDYLVSLLWTLLTGYQCLALTTGLMTRWRVYYPPLSTLIRLLALQAICWPATQFAMQMFDVTTRPVVTWAIVGTTTCMSRSVQIWVTSNLWWDSGSGSSDSSRPPSRKPSSVSVGVGVGGDTDKKTDGNLAVDGPRWRGGRWGGRTWDWNEVVW
ncbi:hypothetical protein PQX77_010077, partial [Marasmius sp. AFHP31]